MNILKPLAIATALSASIAANASIQNDTAATNTYQLAFYHIKTGERHYPQNDDSTSRIITETVEENRSSNCARHLITPKPISVYKHRYCDSTNQKNDNSFEQQVSFNF